jgi:hypothetical protein
VSEQLLDGETSSRPFAAINPNPDPGRAFGLGFAFPLLWASRRIARRRARQSTSERSGIPVSRRMVVAVTGDRLLIWSAGRRWEPDTYLGDISRQRIAGAQAPTVGQGWRSVRIDLVDSDSVTIKVAGQAADELAGLLTPAG